MPDGNHSGFDSTSRTVRMMHRGEKQTAAPAEEPVTRDEAKLWCRIDQTKEDILIDAIIVVARQQVENFTRKQLITATWEMTYDRFPGPAGDSGSFGGLYGFETYGVIELPKNPVQSIESIKYIDLNGVEITLAASEYITDVISEPARITPAVDTFWPATEVRINTVTVEYKSGYGDAAADVPEGIKAAMKLIILDLYAHREAQYEIILRENRLIDNLLNEYRLPSFMDIT